MFAGIDVSKDWFDVAWLVEGQVRNARFDYSDSGIEQLLEHVPAGHTFVMEATGTYHVQLALKLVQAARQVSVVNPLVIKRYGQMKLKRAKTDRADAQLIMRYGYSERPALWAAAHEEVQELQQAHGWLHDLITERVRLLNRQHAHARRAKPSEFVVSQMQLQLQQLNQRIQQCEQHLEELVKKSFAELYARLKSIPSIGSKTALELIIITDGFTRFDDVKQLCAYVGVSPTTYSSGSSVRGKGSIAKLGQPRMRQLIYLCSWTAKIKNPACQQLHERMSILGKPKKVINIAIAHKLLRQAWAVATQKVYFNPNFA